MASKAKFEEEDSAGYRVEIKGRNIEVTDGIRAHIWGKLDKIEKFHNHILHVEVTLELHKLEHSCTVLLKIDHTQVRAHAESSDMYVSIDQAINRIQKLLSRYKSRIQDHHKKKLAMVDMHVNVFERPYNEVDDFNAEIEREAVQANEDAYKTPKIIGKETKPLKQLTTDEALMKIDLSGEQFLIFKAEEDQKLKVLYKRPDGHYGLVQPE